MPFYTRKKTNVSTPNIHKILHQSIYKCTPRDTPSYTNRHMSFYTSSILVYTNRHMRLRKLYFIIYQKTHTSQEHIVQIYMTNSSGDEVTVFTVTNHNKYGGWDRGRDNTEYILTFQTVARKGRLWALQHCCLEAYCALTRISSFVHLQRRCTQQAAWETSASEGRNYTWNLARNP